MKNRIAIKIALIYFLMGFLWILFSDRIIQDLAVSSETLSLFQTFKGWFFVSVTSLLLFLLVKNEINKKRKIELELVKSKEKVEESDRLKSAFLSNMSHEIRTPLNGIMGFCELIQDDSFSEEDKKIFARHMSRNSTDLLKLINDIMDIAKIQENQFEIAKKEFNLNSTLDTIYDSFQQSELRSMRNHVEFMLVKGAENHDIAIHSDPARLANIFHHLLNNSFFYTYEGVVRFGYKKLDSGLEFFVEDSGCGIDDKSKPLIFKPFFKGNNQIVGNKGFGLGLAISKGLVNLLGGNLKFESTANVGSRFYFELNNHDISIGTFS